MTNIMHKINILKVFLNNHLKILISRRNPLHHLLLSTFVTLQPSMKLLSQHSNILSFIVAHLLFDKNIFNNFLGILFVA